MVRIKDDHHRFIKIEAAMTGRTMSEVVADLIETERLRREAAEGGRNVRH